MKNFNILSMKKFTIEHIVSIIQPSFNYEVIGNVSNVYFTNVKSVFEASNDSLTFIDKFRKDKIMLLNETKAAVIICDNNFEINDGLLKDKFLVIVENPRLIFIKIIESLFIEKQNYFYIHPTSIIHPDSKIGSNVNIGPFSIIDECKIFDDVVIENNVHIHRGAKINNNVIIHEHCVIGEDDFNFVLDDLGEYTKFPHLGSVIIEENVEIFPFSAIGKGTLSNTIIQKGSKLDHHVQIGHNSTIGRNTIICANSVVGGSSKIGNNCWIGINVAIRDNITIGDNVIIGMGTIVTKSVPNGETIVGNPAHSIKKKNK